MTATLFSPEPKSKSWYGYRTWVVPSPLLREFILKHKQELAADFRPSLHTNGKLNWARAGDTDVGWKEALAREMSGILHLNTEAILRRLWGVMNDEYHIINAEFAEAAVLSLGLDLDRDTDIPVLPGNIKHAVDLIECRANVAGDELNEMEIRRLAKRAIRVSHLIIKRPYHTSLLVQYAPYNCLKGYA